MGITVQERAEFVGTFRWVELQLMEMLARWVPTTPELEVKVLFGRHIWNCAQHADMLGKRAFELRAPLHYTLPPLQAYREFIEQSAQITETAARVSIFFDAILPGQKKKYLHYLEYTDALMDEPTVRVIEKILDDGERMQEECVLLREEIQLMRTVLDTELIKNKDNFAAFVQHSQDSNLPQGISQ